MSTPTAKERAIAAEDALVAELMARGIKVEQTESSLYSITGRWYEADGFRIWEFSERTQGGIWSQRPTGMLKCKIKPGHWSMRGRTQVFPEPKAGFDAPKLAAAIAKVIAATKEHIESTEAKQARDNRATAACAEVEAMIASVGLPTSLVEVDARTPQPENGVALDLKIGPISPETARDIMDAIAVFGALPEVAA